jgi:two-component system response regulator FixJ
MAFTPAAKRAVGHRSGQFRVFVARGRENVPDHLFRFAPRLAEFFPSPTQAMPEKQIVHIIEDDPAVRESLALLLKSAGLTPTVHDSARAFLDANPPPTGCAISDVRMPEVSGLDLLEELNARRWPIPVVLMTAFADVPLAVRAMKLGAVDFIEKPFDDELIVSAVRAALAQRGHARASDAEAEAAREKLAGLTGREKDVLAGMMKGKLNKTIAHELGISIRTVETHRGNLMAKTGAESLSELIRLSLLAELAAKES